MKKMLQAIIALLLTINCFPQAFTPPAYAEVDNNYRNYVNNLFGALEVNRVPTGLLMDYAFDFAEPKIYNGVVLHDSTLMEPGIFSELYSTIFTSKFNSNAGSLRHPSIHDSLYYIARQKEAITLSGLLFKYNAIQPDANTAGKMDVVNGQLKDKYTNGIWQNPYQEFKTVAITPSTIMYKLTYCSAMLPSNLWLGNMNSEISTMHFDAGDGQGYRSLQFDTPIQLNYADTGWKHWVFKITLTGGQQLYSHSKVHFNNTSNMAGSGGGTQQRGVIDRTETITATEQFNGSFGIADIIISHRNVNDQVIRRPLIIAEGLDPGHITSPEEPEGDNTFEGFVRSIQFSNSPNLINLIANGFNSEYDIIYINWRNGTDWLQRNALVLEEVIRWVNANKQPLNGVRQPNVVLGSSMGGVIARMALGRMDRSGGFNAHETRLYISMDAPHQGANVPLGFQAAARHATRLYISSGVAGVIEFIQLIRNRQSPLQTLVLADQPAARQLLSNRIDFFYNPSNSTHQNFMNDLRTQWAYPDNIRNIAISNGNECAIDQEFTAGSSLLYHHRSTKTRFIGDLIFMVAGLGLKAIGVSPLITIPLVLPGSNKFELTLDIKALANGGGNQVYYGNIKYTKKVLWFIPVSINIANKAYNAPSGLLPFDTYPGGFYTVILDNQPGSVSQDWMFSYNNSFSVQRRFSFIPTTSALDIGEGNTALTNANYLARYIGGTPPAPPLNTPFDNFATAFNQDGSQWIFNNTTFRRINNEPHEGFFIRNANWLATELNRVNPTDPAPQTNCNAFCENGIIDGDALNCNTETYTAPFGNGVTYNWFVSNPALVLQAANGNSFQLTRNGNASGVLQITVQITGACGVTALTREVTIGSPVPGPISFPLIDPTFGRIHATIEPVLNATSYNWYKNGTLHTTHHGTFAQIPISKTQCDIEYDIAVEAINNCGTSNRSHANAPVPCEFGFMISPNPASGSITVSSDESKMQSVMDKTFEEVRIYDLQGNMKKQQKFNKVKTATINIAGLSNGTYIIEIINSSYKERKQLVIQK